MTDTLTPLHEELDTSLERILWEIDLMAQNAVWDLQMMGRPIGTAPFIIEPAFRTWAEQRKLWERYRDTMEIKHALPGGLRHERLPGLDVDMAFDAAFPGLAGQRILGNEPWHFEYTAPKLPWWKRTWLYRKVKGYRIARAYGASKRKALGLKIWPRQSGKASR